MQAQKPNQQLSPSLKKQYPGWRHFTGPCIHKGVGVIRLFFSSAKRCRAHRMWKAQKIILINNRLLGNR